MRQRKIVLSVETMISGLRSPFLRRSGTSVRYFAAPRKQFLPFEEARAWARQQGVNGQKEWRALGAIRPGNIPSNPDRAYPNEYKSIYDWVGSPRPRDIRAPGDETAYQASRSEHYMRKKEMHGSGLDLLERAAPQFRFFRMPLFSRVDMLFQPRDVVDDDRWVGLVVKTSGGRRKDGRAYYDLSPSKRDYAVVCIDLPPKDIFVLEPDLFVQVGTQTHKSLTLRRGGDGKCDDSFVPTLELPVRLSEVFQTQTQLSFEVWLKGSVFSPRDSLLQSIHIEYRNLLYKPCNLEAKFCLSSSPDDVADLELNGIKMLQRTGGVCPGKTGLAVRSRKNCRRKVVPFGVMDRCDFMQIAVISDTKRLRGTFLFPKDFLIGEGVFASENFRGSMSFFVYPPFVRMQRNPGTQERQAKYYIDLDDRSDAGLTLAREKYMSILLGKD